STTILNICERTSKSSSTSTTIGNGCTRRWAIDPRKNSSKRPNPWLNLEARRWSFLRTKRTAKRILRDCSRGDVLRSATMEFFENKENSKKNSKGLLGKGTQMPSPSPDPFSC